MDTIRHIIVFIGCALLLGSCMKPDHLERGADYSHAYFDIKGLMEQQVADLSANSVVLEKITNINGKHERHLMRIDRGKVTYLEGLPADESKRVAVLDWKRDLDIFADADINKPILSQSYSIDTLNGAGPGVELFYQALNPELKVQWVRVGLDSLEASMPVYAKAFFQEHNPIYISEQHLRMDFAAGHLVQYALTGFQKMNIQDTLIYALDANIEWAESSK